MPSVATRTRYNENRLRSAEQEIDDFAGVTIGSATLNFGAFPGSNEASVSFADTSVLAGSNIQAWFAADSSTADHTADDHRYAPIFIHLTALPTAGVGGTIYARSQERPQWRAKLPQLKSGRRTRSSAR